MALRSRTAHASIHWSLARSLPPISLAGSSTTLPPRRKAAFSCSRLLLLALLAVPGAGVSTDASLLPEAVVSHATTQELLQSDREEARIVDDVFNPFGRDAVTDGWFAAVPSEAATESEPAVQVKAKVNGIEGAVDVFDRVHLSAELKRADRLWASSFAVEVFWAIRTPGGEWFSLIGYSSQGPYLADGIQGQVVTFYPVSDNTHNPESLAVSVQGLEPGTYEIYFCADFEINGSPDYGQLIWSRAAANVLPLQAELSASPMSGPAPLTVDYLVKVNDPRGTFDHCVLTLDDGREFLCNFPVSVTYDTAGAHQASAEVWDRFGRSVATNAVTINVEPVTNQSPRVRNLTVDPRVVIGYDERFVINYYYDDPDGLGDVKIHHIGIGTASLTYEAGGSGQFRHEFHFTSPSTPGIHYIEAWVEDSAGNYSNVLKDSVELKERDVKECGTFTEAGSDAEEVHFVELGQRSGVFWFDYDTLRQPDRITIWQDEKMIWDSRCVGTEGRRSTQVVFNGRSSMVKVKVEPNCKSGTGTRWSFTLYCPAAGS